MSNIYLDEKQSSKLNVSIGNLHDIVENILSYTVQECPDTLDLMNFYGKLCPENLTNKSILKEVSWIAYAGGFRYDVMRKYWPKITEAFFDFNVKEVALLSTDLDTQAQIICRESGFKNLRKAKWCILNAKRIIELDCELREIGGLKGYVIRVSKMGITEIVTYAPSILGTLKFKGIGKTTIFHFLKNMGVDVFKPDIHVRRILYKLGLIDEQSSIYEICGAMRSLAASHNLKISELDTLFFNYGKETADFIPFNNYE